MNRVLARRPRRTHRRGRARHGPRRPSEGGAAARPALRSRPVDAPALHHRRHDRQQRVRQPRAGLRPDVRQRPGAPTCSPRARSSYRRRRHGCAAARTVPTLCSTTCDGRGPPSRDGTHGVRPVRTTGQRVRRRSTCCPSGSTSRSSSSGPRARSRSSRRRPCASSTDPAHRVLVAIGFDDIVKAGEAAPTVEDVRPDRVRGHRRRGWSTSCARVEVQAAVPPLPRGAAWLFVEIAGDDADGGARPRPLARRCRPRVSSRSSSTTRRRQARLWRIREDGAGLAGRAPSGQPAWPGWEDAAVPPEMLGSYLARFDELVTEHGLTSAPVRALRRRLHARAARLPARQSDGLPRLRRFLDRRRGPGRRVRRLALGRARRRPRAQRAAAPDVLRRRHRASSARSSTSSTPTTCSTPVCSSTPTRSTPTSASRGVARRTASSWPSPTRRRR